MRSSRGPVLACLVAILVLLAGCSSSSASAATSQLEVSGTANGWTFHDGQSVTVSMGPNKTFKPGLRLNIIECADPGGSKAKLPTQSSACDEDTIQANSLIPAADGSFSYSGYTMYRLPSEALGEGATYLPVCNATHKCVLYVGEDQSDFSKPKVFSQPFVVTGGAEGS